MCPSVGTPWASTASPSFVQRSSRESSASSLTWSRKLSSFGFVRFDIGVEEGTAACLRECQKLGLGSIRCVPYFHCISRVPSELNFRDVRNERICSPHRHDPTEPNSYGQKTKIRLVPPRALRPDRNFATWSSLPRLGSAPLTCYSVFTDVHLFPANAAAEAGRSIR